MNKHNNHIVIPILGARATDFYQGELERQSQISESADLPLLLLETDFERINANLPDKYKALTPLVGCLLRHMEETGAPVYLIPNITLHAAVARIELDEQTLHRIINPIDCGITHLKAQEIEEITLVGTRHTMQSDQLAGFFESRGITVKFPETDDISALDALRLQVFEEGFSKGAKKDMDKILSRYDNPVLACTELSILNRESQFIDLARLQIAAALKRL